MDAALLLQPRTSAFSGPGKKFTYATSSSSQASGLVRSSLMLCLAFASCGRNQTAKLLQGKKWEVYDVTPPGGTFSIEASNRAQELKDGFYKNAWFRFLPDGIFIAS